jgi:hypothetical protein
MIPLQGRLESRRTAPFHVQLELEKTQKIRRVPDDVRIQGRSIRVFRTDGRLAVGDRVEFTLWVCRPGDEPTGPAYIDYDDFVAASYMEAYLYGDPPACELAAYEFAVIAGPSEAPTLTQHELEALLGHFDGAGARRSRAAKAVRWRFWKR